MMRRYTLALLSLAMAACAQNGSAPATAGAAVAPSQDWVARAAAAVRVSDDPYDTRDCEFVSVLSVPAGFDGQIKDMTAAEEQALYQMKVAAVGRGGNFVLLYPGPEPSGEAYLCTE